MNISKKLLLGRFLTRTGDQAWDFALPLILLVVFPNQLRLAASFYFIVRLLNTILLPRVSVLIDRWSRNETVKLGILLQSVGVASSAASLYCYLQWNLTGQSWLQPAPLLLALVFTFGGTLSSLGASFMDIAIANDLVPSSIQEHEMTAFNSRLRQVDLFTEVVSPFLAGFILLINPEQLTGFFILAAWNLISFFPELELLNSIFKERPDLRDKPISVAAQSKLSIFAKLKQGWAAFFAEPVALVCIAYAMLWLSVLSPHGVLLAAYLKDAWNLPEWGIGMFRGLGAIFGLLATVLFPPMVRKFGLEVGTQRFILFQSFTVLVGLVFFFSSEYLWAQIGFLALILLSRIGLYGFSLGEMQIRQVQIPAPVRGQVNGFASALTGFATLFLYGAGALLPETADFKYLVTGSIIFVCLGAIFYSVWLKRQKINA